MKKLFVALSMLIGCPSPKGGNEMNDSLSGLTLPDRIVILRHGEDIHRSSDEILTPQGLARADALAAAIPDWPVLAGKMPGAVFATSLHTVQTVKLTAMKLSLPLLILSKPKKYAEWIALGYQLQGGNEKTAKYYPDSKDMLINTTGDDRVADLVKELHSPKYRGMTVVICWVHEEIPRLVQELGYVGVPDWPKVKHADEVFDRFWVLDFLHDKSDEDGRFVFDVTKNIKPQRLLASDM